jgi:hypothetical protein
MNLNSPTCQRRASGNQSAAGPLVACQQRGAPPRLAGRGNSLASRGGCLPVITGALDGAHHLKEQKRPSPTPPARRESRLGLVISLSL